jgi:hypothetical protein
MSLSLEVEVTADDARGTVASVPLHLDAMSPGVVVRFIDLSEVHHCETHRSVPASGLV